MPHDPGFDDYLSVETARASYDRNDAGKDKAAGFSLLWGDGVHVLEGDGSLRKVRARGQTGWIDKNQLGGMSLLEIYFIDVGQGDGLLIKTPDFRHIMLDGGYSRRSQPTGKSAADFIDWKFFKDYGAETIVLDAMIASHIDFDHYGGLDDLLDVDQVAELDCSGITIDAFYHGGLSHWAAFGETREGLGPFEKTADGRKWFTRLLDDRVSAEAATGGTGPQLRGRWGALIEKVVAARSASGTPTAIQRLSQQSEWLPGHDAGDEVPIRVLGPIAGEKNGRPTLLRLDTSQSINTNGTSVLLRVDHGKARILLTGDLNAKAHQSLLAEYAGREDEFTCDVGKCCHHGSEDVSFTFLQHMHAACTVISSGDHEGHDHPRPRVVAASGLTGFREIRDDKLVTPLVYSTELARSVELGRPESVVAGTGAVAVEYGTDRLDEVSIAYKVTAAGALNPGAERGTLDRMRVMHKLIYGLVNIRTDGNRIVAATMNEGDRTFAVKSFDARF